MFRSSRRAVAGPHRPLNCEFIRVVQSVRSGGRRATADGMGRGPANWRGGKTREEAWRAERRRMEEKSEEGRRDGREM